VKAVRTRREAGHLGVDENLVAALLESDRAFGVVSGRWIECGDRGLCLCG
jgi:hypothetical protein